MRFTRAAKVAAFPLTALILVALVACQGPAGPAGAGGGKGDPGAMGSSGTPGAPGIRPIVKTDKAEETILLNPAALDMLGSATAVVDVTGYFRGGKPPVTYAVVPTTGQPSDRADTVDADDAIFKVVLDKDTGQLTVTAKTPRVVIDPAAKYMTGEKVTIKATDADKIAAAGTVMLTIKANRAPMAASVIADAEALVVGTQNAKDALRDGRHNTTAAVLATQPNPVCATFASCVFTIKLQDGAAESNATLTRYDEADDATAIAAMTATPVIIDDDTAGMTFSIVEYDAKKVLASASGNKIMIGGVKSTWGMVNGSPGHVTTAVVIMATDSKGLPEEHEIPVAVDGAPTLSKTHTFLNRYTFDPGQNDSVFGRNVGDYFDDMESDAALTYTITSSNHAVADPPDDPLTQDGMLMMLLAQGTATVTITATDPLGQTVKAEFVFNVNSPTTADG